MTFNSAAAGDFYAPVPTRGPGLTQARCMPVLLTSSETVKRKRGRPKKHRPNDTMSSGFPTSDASPAPAASAAASLNQAGGSGAFRPGPPADSAKPVSTGKKRGRPKGSVNKNKNNTEASSSSSGPRSELTPHLLLVNAGEDISSKIIALAHANARNFCILSAIGSISNVTLRQPSIAGGTVTYEGRFEIITLRGSLVYAKKGNDLQQSAGGLSVSLSGPEGNVLGGGVAGLLVAASTVQIVLGSFVGDGSNSSMSEKKIMGSCRNFFEIRVVTGLIAVLLVL
ncbi:hypothetical protein RJT34_08289 [Clitoria ternatea]|uniref:AT-hook motif nuclear-localized protein n=1 Tax=Clitoria ternatea TaxID=43366 RepID=A0AAN9PU07_CLITE